MVGIDAWNTGSTTVAVADNMGNTYAQAIRQQGTSDHNDVLAIWWCIPTTGGSGLQVTVTPSASSYMDVCIAEYSYTPGATISVESTNGSSASSNAATSGNLTLTGSDLVFCAVDLDASVVPTAGSGFVIRYDGHNNIQQAAFEDQAPTSGR